MLSIGCLLFLISPVSSFGVSSLPSVSSVFYPLPISVLHLLIQKWFNVQLTLLKSINTRFVMKLAELRMELLILLSLLSLLFFFSMLFFIPFFLYCSSGTILVNQPHFLDLLLPFLSSVCCGCCAVAPTKIEIKKKNKIKRLNFPKLGKQENNELVKWIAPDFFQTTSPDMEREKRR